MKTKILQKAYFIGLLMAFLVPRLAFGQSRASLTLSSPSLAVGETTTIEAHLDCGATQCVAVDMVLLYDPVLVEVISLELGDYLSSDVFPLTDIDDRTGEIHIVATTLGGREVTGPGLLFILTIRGLAPGQMQFVGADVEIGDIEPIPVSIYGGIVQVRPEAQSATQTAVLSPSPSATMRPSRTPQPTSTPQPTQAGCPNVLPSRLVLGQMGQVTPGLPNVIRSQPSTASDRIGQIPAGGEFDVLDGPVCAQGYAWWRVLYNTITGWTAEGDQYGYWLEPIQERAAVSVSGGSRVLGSGVSSPRAALALDDLEGKIAFSSTRDGNLDIFIVNADGSSARNLTQHDAIDDQPFLSPDGSQIAFISNRDQNFEIYLMNSDGSNQRNLTNHGANDFLPSWSPDSSRVIFISDRSGVRDIYSIRTDGTDLQQLTWLGVSDSRPSLSSNGSSLLFAQGRSSNAEIYALDLDEGSRRSLTRNGSWDYRAAWSPDGSQIVFLSDRDNNVDIYLMDDNGGDVRRMTESLGDDDVPAWSPDGRHFVFMSVRGGNRDLYVMNVESGAVDRLTNTSWDEAWPSWSR